MAKPPSMQFYPSDWLRDMEEHPLDIEGAWLRIVNKLWWEEERGKGVKTLVQWSRVLRIDTDYTARILQYIRDEKIGDVLGLVTERNKNIPENNEKITVICRRMHREWKEKENNRLRQDKYRQKRQKQENKQENNGDITPSRARFSASASAIKSNPKGLLCETKVSSPTRTPGKKLIELYHTHCPSLPKVVQIPISETSQKNLRRRWREHPDLDWWVKYFQSVAASDFLTGKVQSNDNRAPFVADFHWLIRPSNMEKIINGRYINRYKPHTETPARKKVHFVCPRGCEKDPGVWALSHITTFCAVCEERRIPEKK